MASLDPKFHEETISIHKEHEELLAQLDQLDAAVEQMACYAEIFTDLATANQAMSRGKWVAEWLPKHYEHEETTVLETIAQDESGAGFVRSGDEAPAQGNAGAAGEFPRQTGAHLSETSDLENAVNEMKREGKDLTRMMRLHMAAEEKKFASVEN